MPHLGARPASIEAWWKAVHGLVAGWYDVPAGRVGSVAPEAVELSELLGRAIPQGVHEWCNFCRHLNGHGLFEKVMRDNLDFGWKPELDAVTLLLQAEGDHYWGLPADQLHHPDPPVDTWVIDHDTQAETWQPQGRKHGTIAEFAFLHVLAYVRGAGRVRGIANGREELALLDRLLSEAASTRSTVGSRLVFEGPDLIASVWAEASPERHHFDVVVGQPTLQNLPPSLERVVQAAHSLEGGFVAAKDRRDFELPGWTLNVSNSRRRPLIE